MGGPMDDPPSGDDSGTTYEASHPEGNGQDATSQPTPGDDASAVMNGNGDGSTGPAQDSATPDPDAEADSSAGDTGAPPQDSSSGQQDSPSEGEDAGPPETGAPSYCAGPSTPAACHACSPGPNCQANGCYNKYVCNTLTGHCGAPGTCS
jgi:hypothetical protein